MTSQEVHKKFTKQVKTNQYDNKHFAPDLLKIAAWQNKMLITYGNPIAPNQSVWSTFRNVANTKHFSIEITIFCDKDNSSFYIYDYSSVADMEKYISVLLRFFNGEFKTLEDFKTAKSI